MSMNSAAELTNIQGQQVALTHVDINAQIIDLISRVSVTQTYKNTEENNIEAVYTFPLPVDAVLLDLTVTLGEKTLKGQVVEKKQAEERYEDAITDGDSAIMLQQSQSGTFTMNVGNLLPGELIVIKFSYGTLHSFANQSGQNKSLRFMLPTTIAPRYGDAIQSGLEAHQTPEHTMGSNFGFNFSLEVKGILAHAAIDSPTHKIAINVDEQSVKSQPVNAEVRGTSISLQNTDVAMDRDFVINFNDISMSENSTRVERGHSGYVALSSFLCNFDLTEDTSPRSFKILVDCSGSMTGDSIKQAKIALERVLSSLRDGDFFNIIKFGTHYTMLATEQVCINKLNRQVIFKYIQGIQADMGGSEMAAALDATYKISQNLEFPHDVLLITDGEVWNSANMVEQARNSQHRIFTIGIGSAVAENVVRELADVTAGVCELVTPNESMADKVYRHFKRIFAPRAKSVEINWPAVAKYSSPKEIKKVFDGDTLHVFAWFDDIPEGVVEISIALPDGRIVREESDCQTFHDTGDDFFLTRMGIAQSLKELHLRAGSQLDDKFSEQTKGRQALYQQKSKEDLAVEYQLMTTWTNYLVIHERAGSAKADILPELRKVPQTLAAGWGGIGSVSKASQIGRRMYAQPVVRMDLNLDHELLSYPDFLLKSKIDCELERSDILNDNVDNISEYKTLSIDKLNHFIKRLDVKLREIIMTDLSLIDIQYLEALGMPKQLSESINLAQEDGYDEQDIVLVILSLLSEYEEACDLHRHIIRLIKLRVKNTDVNCFDLISDYFPELKVIDCIN